MSAYYNEIDPFAAAWLRELIKAGEIAPGDVDERDIRDVTPGDLNGYTQCHFFAGIGVWSYALRQAGWPDDRSVWTGSCPCQPFSSAGKGGGFDDERHLWPAWHHLIRIRRPATVFGEQVASKDGLNWFDLVQADMESESYAIGAADLCAAGLGAPHIRQRLWFVAERLEHAARDGRGERRTEPSGRGALGGRGDCRMADGIGSRLEGLAGHGDERHEPGWIDPQQDGPTAAQGAARGLALSDRTGLFAWGEATQAAGHGNPAGTEGGDDQHGPARPTDGFWRDADWLFCRDGKWRPVEPCTFPLAHGAPARVGRLRGYGNAIPAPVAQAFIETASGRVCITGPSVITTDEDVFS